MFGSRTKDLESRLASVQSDLKKMTDEKNSLEKELSSARSRLAQLEGILNGSDVETLQAQAKETIAEYEGLKKMYSDKIKDFDDSREEQEQNFAREAAVRRHHLDNEIADKRQSSEEYVAQTVNTFSETYNYYLSQIKVLMDALGQVAEQTGRTLFHSSTENLKVNFGQQLAETLKTDTGALPNGDGDLIVIGASEADIDLMEARAVDEPGEELPEEEIPAVETAVEETAAEEAAFEELPAEEAAEEVPAEEAAEDAEPAEDAWTEQEESVEEESEEKASDEESDGDSRSEAAEEDSSSVKSH